MSTCTCCGQDKPDDEFHPKPYGKGLRGQCKQCEVDKARARRLAWRAPRDHTPTGEGKFCASCHTLRDTSEFVSDRSRGDGLSTACRTCRARRWRQYVEKSKRRSA